MEQAVREKRIRLIPATKEKTPTGGPSGRKLRVAAYCRVSTDNEEQLTSYTSQKEYYTQKIGENPDWEFAGIFADRGITGTSMKKRAEFNRMIAACKRGRIDLILTKSLSRFARNTVDCLLRPGGERVHPQQCDLGHSEKPGGWQRALPVYTSAGLSSGSGR